MKLVGHLVERERNPGEKGALLIFDEPTTGLHFDDVALLVRVFQRLVEQGDSLLVIEHNLEVIKCADYLVDIGPEAGTVRRVWSWRWGRRRKWRGWRPRTRGII